MKKILAGFALASVLAFGQGRGVGPGGAGPGGMGPGGMGPGGIGLGGGPRVDPANAPLDLLQTYLGLTADQVTKLRANQTALREASKALAEQLQERNQTLRTLMQGTAPNPTEVGNLMVDMKNLRTQLDQLHDKYMAEALKLLTPDQVTKLKQLEAAQKLAPTIGQAMRLLLLDRPEPAQGAPGMGLGRPFGMPFRR